MLSDACSGFNLDIERGIPVTEATEKFLKAVEWYGRPECPLNYPRQHIEMLRHAIAPVIANPNDAQSLQTLLTISAGIRILYDSGRQQPFPEQN